MKTSTDFALGGATKEDVSFLYRSVKYKGSLKVKTSAVCQEMFKAGVEKIGT